MLQSKRQTGRKPPVRAGANRTGGHALHAVDYKALAQFRFQLRKFLSFSEAAAHQAGLTPQQHQALLAIKGFSGAEPDFRGRSGRIPSGSASHRRRAGGSNHQARTVEADRRSPRQPAHVPEADEKGRAETANALENAFRRTAVGQPRPDPNIAVIPAVPGALAAQPAAGPSVRYRTELQSFI